MTVVVPFPVVSEIDAQYEDLERQRRLIREQFAQIKTHNEEQEYGKRKLRQLLGDAART